MNIRFKKNRELQVRLLILSPERDRKREGKKRVKGKTRERGRGENGCFKFRTLFPPLTLPSHKLLNPHFLNHGKTSGSDI